MIFETKRLTIKVLVKADFDNFSRLLSDEAIVSLIPQVPFSVEEIKNKFYKAVNTKIQIIEDQVTILGVFLKNETELIGLCAFLTNDEESKELGYRFLEESWGCGYATELTEGAIRFCFKELKIDKLTADVAVKNLASAKVLSKFFFPVKEFYNEADSCFDRRYELKRYDWNG